jgi:hypothetical protein
MKVYSFLNQEAYDAILATAEEVDMGVDGHIPNVLSVEYVLASQQNLIVHAEEVMKKAQGNYDQELVDYFSKIVAESDTWVTPTLIMPRNILASLDDLDKDLSRPEVRYVHPLTVRFWSPPMYRYAGRDPEPFRRGFEFQQQFTKGFNDAGVKLMTGTDSISPTVVPGFSTHRELEELVNAGLTPYQALRASTTNPFEFLGELDDAGTVEVGKCADLVLLEENPLKDITNTRKIAGVMIQGHWLSQTELQEGLDELAAYYEAERSEP